MIDHKTAAFHVQDFHARTSAVHKYVNVPVLYVASHLVGHHSAQGIKTAAHICWIRISTKVGGLGLTPVLKVMKV